MSGWTKMPPLLGHEHHHGCLNCSPTPLLFLPYASIMVGFGKATVTRDGEVVYDEGQVEAEDWDDFATGADAERMAALEPDHDWRIHIVGPLSEVHYQRQEAGWVLYEKGMGFA